MLPNQRSGAHFIQDEIAPASRKHTPHSMKNAAVLSNSRGSGGKPQVTVMMKAVTSDAQPAQAGTLCPSPSASSMPAKKGIIRIGK